MARIGKEWYADFETTGFDYNPDYAYVSVWGLKDSDGEQFHWGIGLDSFYAKIIELNIKTIFFHNLGFDGDFIWKDLLIKGFLPVDDVEIKKEEKDLEADTFTFLQDQTRTIYSMSVNFGGHKVDFRCSYLVLRTSISDLGKALGFPKGEYDYKQIKVYASNEDVPPELITYLERDIDIARTALSRFSEEYKLSITQASAGMDSFVQMYGERQFAQDFGGFQFKNGKRVWVNVLTKEQWAMANEAYSGGYTNFPVDIKDQVVLCPNGVSIDINSSYPHKMRDYMLPYGEMYEDTPPDVGNFITFIKVRIHQADIKDPRHPPILRDKHRSFTFDVKYLSHIGKNGDSEAHKLPQEYTFVLDEWEYIKSVYTVSFEIQKVFYFKAKVIFKNWVDEIYGRKLTAETAYEILKHKGILNSNSGKFGQSPVKVNQKLVYDPENLVVGKMRYGKNREWYLDTEEIESEHLHYVPVIACICAYGRIQLWRMIRDNLDNWLYCDTDSMYSSDQIKCDPRVIDTVRLGAWKPEYRFTKFKVLKTKCYIFEATHKYNKTEWAEFDEPRLVRKIAGLSNVGKEMIKSFDDFYLGATITGGKLAKKDTPTGKFLIETDHTFKEFA